MEGGGVGREGEPDGRRGGAEDGVDVFEEGGADLQRRCHGKRQFYFDGTERV